MRFIEQFEQRVLLPSWFVATNGHDSNPGTFRRPFATIQQAANVAQPGDTVFIRKGVYPQATVPTRSGTAAAPITFRPFGREVVTIDGADLVTGLSQTAPGVFTASVAGDLGEGSNQIFSNGVMLNEAQWPPTPPNTAKTLSLPATAMATDATVQPAVNGIATATLDIPSLQDPGNTWVGATIHVAQGQQWVFQTGTVTASSPGSITYTFQPLAPYSYQMPGAGTRFYLTDDAAAFNSDGGAWFYDSATGQLSLHETAQTKKNAPAIEMKHRLYAFDLSGLSNIDIVGINLFACNINSDATSSNDMLNRLTARYVSQATNFPDPWSDQFHPHTTGIILNGTNNTVENSTIAFSSGDGVFLGGSNKTVQNCLIHDVDYAGGDEAGVTSLGSSNRIASNTIYNCSRSGIVGRYSPQASILNNRIFNCGLQTTDLGGIYMDNTDGQDTVIGCNVISDIRTGGFGGVGLYLDNGSSNYIVDHNVTWNVDIAAKVNPPGSGNLWYNNTLTAVTTGLATSAGGAMPGDLFINNIFTVPAEFGSGAEVENNLLTPTDPLFVNAARNNYQLRRGSPAMNVGIVVSPVTNGFKGSAPDEGAYEFGVRPFRVGALRPAALP